MNHIPVLLYETLYFLKISDEKKYIDCTFGFGGHTKEILKLGGSVLGLDVDAESLKLSQEDFYNFDKLTLVQANFRNLEEVAQKHGFEKVDGILLDLGLSSWHLDSSGRGFSFRKEENLDMRMDKNLQVKALDLIKVLPESKLAELFEVFGEEKLAHFIAKELKKTEVETTSQLTQIVKKVYQSKYRDKSQKNPATKVFQALRIAVNDELNCLKKVLPQAERMLNPGGRLIVISFHSLEDRIVKRFLRGSKDFKIITKKPITASKKDLVTNPRASSAKMRVAEKI